MGNSNVKKSIHDLEDKYYDDSTSENERFKIANRVYELYETLINREVNSCLGTVETIDYYKHLQNEKMKAFNTFNKRNKASSVTVKNGTEPQIVDNMPSVHLETGNEEF